MSNGYRYDEVFCRKRGWKYVCLQLRRKNFIPEEVAEVANFLVSDASKCVTGQIFYCDGGDHLKSNIQID